MTIFTARAWEETAQLREAIHALPFNRELTSGTLSQDRFQFYVVQDALYLEQFSRALTLAAAKAPDTEAMEQFAGSAVGAIAVERALHSNYFKTFGISADQAAATEPSPTCCGYTNFLLATAHQAGYAALIAALLPCFWIYWDVGNAIARQTQADNPYKAWIDTYSDPEFGKAVEAVKAIADRTASTVSPGDETAMLSAFKRSTQYEWMFWDSAYRREPWPIDA